MAAETSSAAADYVEREINPTLIRALQALCHARPSNPVEWLANWLLRYQQDHRRATLVDSQERAEFKDFISTRMARFHLTPTEELIDRVAFGYAASGGLTLADAEKLWCGDNHPFPMFDSAVLQPQPADKPGAAYSTRACSRLCTIHLAVAETAKRALALRGYTTFASSSRHTPPSGDQFKREGLRRRAPCQDAGACRLRDGRVRGHDAYYSDVSMAYARPSRQGCLRAGRASSSTAPTRQLEAGEKEVSVGIGTLVVVAPRRPERAAHSGAAGEGGRRCHLPPRPCRRPRR